MKPRPALMILVMFTMFYFTNFYRSSPAIIAPFLLQEFSIGAERLGLLSSIFFYVFAFAQIPLGPALDSIGLRKVVTILGLVAAVGSFIFASAHSFNLCLLGRGLTGLGFSCMLMASFMTAAIWYPPRKFATLAGLVSATGNLGIITATVPLAILAVNLGWRGTFFFFAGILFFFAILVWLVVRDRPPAQIQNQVPAKEKYQIKEAYRAVLGNTSFWGIAVLTFFVNGSILSMQTLWGGPFLMDVFGFTPQGAGVVLAMAAIGCIVGSPLLGMISDRWVRSRKRMIWIWALCYCVPLLLLSTTLQPSRSFLLFPVYFALGFFGVAGVLVYSHIKELFPPKIHGTALTCNNFFSMGGVAVLQYLMGILIERHPAVNHVYPLAAYRDAFFLLFVGLVLALLFYLKTAKEKPFAEGNP
jgi:predicted MFS family arabinose efflux permease